MDEMKLKTNMIKSGIHFFFNFQVLKKRIPKINEIAKAISKGEVTSPLLSLIPIAQIKSTIPEIPPAMSEALLFAFKNPMTPPMNVKIP